MCGSIPFFVFELFFVNPTDMLLNFVKRGVRTQAMWLQIETLSPSEQLRGVYVDAT